MKKILMLAVLLMVALAGNAQNFPAQQSCFPEARVCTAGPYHYMVCSSYQYFPGLTLYRSRDMARWEPVGGCLTRRSQMEAVGGYVRVDGISFEGGVFCVTARSPKGQFQVTARDPLGEWSEPELTQGDAAASGQSPAPQPQYVMRPANALSTARLEQQGWQWLGWPRMENYHFMKTGALRLIASQVSLDQAFAEVDKTPTFMGLRRESEDFTVETELAMDTKALSSSEAGLCVFMSDEVHAELLLRKYPSSDLGFCPVAATLRITLCGLVHQEEEMMLPSGTARLKVEGSASGCRFFCAGAGQDYEPLGTLDARLLAADAPGSPAGMVIGMYAYSEGATSTYADFKYFKYLGR